MASKQFVLPLRSIPIQPTQSIRRNQNGRSMATYPSATPPSSLILPSSYTSPSPSPSLIHLAPSTVQTTLYSFPTMEPMAFLNYASSHLNLPLRKDILHRAVVYEGDRTRQGTASTKWRSEVHGSNAKIRPQKGTGRARLGDKKSPMLKGGGVAFGPKPRDFATGLNKKVYDLAFRTALSYRWRRGELVVCDHFWSPGQLNQFDARYWANALFDRLGWGKGKGRSLLIRGAISEQEDKRDKWTEGQMRLQQALDHDRSPGRMKAWYDVDVKNLLEMGRLVVERKALNDILRNHQRDLKMTQWTTKFTTSAGIGELEAAKDFAAADGSVEQPMAEEIEEELNEVEDELDISSPNNLLDPEILQTDEKLKTERDRI